MYLNEQLVKKWEKVIDYDGLPKITDPHKRSVLASVLENQEKEANFLRAMSGTSMGALLTESAPTNQTGGSVATFDPVLISMVRRSQPNLMAYDVCGVQNMTGPTGLIFALRSRYTNQSGAEALFNEANTTFSGSAAGNTASAVASNNQTGTSPSQLSTGSEYTFGKGMSTAAAEALGDGSANAFRQMAFTIEKVTATAVSRALKAEYSMEVAQDLMAVHGLEAERILSNMLTSEILAEINREVIRTINSTATQGAQENVAIAGEFDLDVDSNGRWLVEKFKGLMFQIERDCNQISYATRRGKGNLIICSSDVASALQMAGVLDYTPALKADLTVDDTGNTFAGVIGGKLKVYIDPYHTSVSGKHYVTVGYKGTDQFDAGLFYCPYIPLTMVRGQTTNASGVGEFQPKIGYKTRYAMVANPFATSSADGAISFSKKNKYYRRITIKNLM